MKIHNDLASDLAVKGKGRTYGAKAPFLKGEWNTLAVSARGAEFTVTFNGKQLYAVEDKTFTTAGKTGMWTKADSVMQFDNFSNTVVK